jgi:hypothetical protein
MNQRLVFWFLTVAVAVTVSVTGSSELSKSPSDILLGEYFGDWAENTFYFSTRAASVFVAAENSTFKIFIPMVTVYYLRVAA